MSEKVIPERIWIVNHVAGPESGVLSRGLLFRSIYNSKEEAERYVKLACHTGETRIDEYASEAKVAEHAATIENLKKALQSVIDERDSEIDMMQRKYRMGTPEFDIWLEGVKAMWARLDVIKSGASEALSKQVQHG